MYVVELGRVFFWDNPFVIMTRLTDSCVSDLNLVQGGETVDVNSISSTRISFSLKIHFYTPFKVPWS